MRMEPQGNSGILPFDFEGFSVRIVTRDGEPWFFLIDVCRILDIGNPSQVAQRLDDDEKSTLSRDEGNLFNGLGVIGSMPTIVNETGLWRVVMRSDKPRAKTFQKWVTGTVLPSIRKTGSYGVVDPRVMLNDPSIMRGLLLGYTEKVIALEAKVDEQAPKVDAFDRLSGAEDSLCVTDAAKGIDMQRDKLFRWLETNKWIYRRPGTKYWIAYQDRIHSGDLEHRVLTIPLTDGTEKVTQQVLVTARGMARLARIAI